jgi:hypothetical protein
MLLPDVHNFIRIIYTVDLLHGDLMYVMHQFLMCIKMPSFKWLVI